MSVQTRIYLSGAFAFGGQPAVNDLLAAEYSAVLVWSVHVLADGTLQLNNTPFVKDGVYKETKPMDLPSRLAQLRKAGSKIIFSVGSGFGANGPFDFTQIQKLMGGKVPGPKNILYKNFKALKEAMVAAGGDIDAIDFDNEDNLVSEVMVNFASMLHNIGYMNVTFCPYSSISVWTEAYNKLLDKYGKYFVSAIHLQCYSGGRYNSPEPWGQMIADAGGEAYLIPGLATNQADPGPWWNGQYKQIGGSVVKTPNVAMYKKADWSRMLRRGNYATAEEALKAADGSETFFFYCREYMNLGPDKIFHPGDAVFFSGEPWWGGATQCDGYSLSGPCSNIYNENGACPKDLQNQYATWKTEKYPPDGGFIWLYDSVVNCLLSGCCGGTEKSPTTTAKDYREAITNGLS